MFGRASAPEGVPIRTPEACGTYIAFAPRASSNGHMRAIYLLPLLAACGSDPVNFSEPVGIELDAKSGDAINSVVTENKDITTESGNPYGKFVSDAMAKLGGHDPSLIDIPELTLTLGAQSTGVTSLDEVVTGDVDIAFLVNNTNDTYDVAHVMSPTGIGPVAMQTVFDWTQVSATDRTTMLGGGFKVVLRAPAAASFSTKGADARLQATFTFTAFK